MAGTGAGSQLIIRAREAALRSKTASALGLTKPFQSNLGASVGAPANGPDMGMPQIRSAQPPTAGAADRPSEEKMYAEVEEMFARIDPFSGNWKGRS